MPDQKSNVQLHVLIKTFAVWKIVVKTSYLALLQNQFENFTFSSFKKVKFCSWILLAGEFLILLKDFTTWKNNCKMIYFPKCKTNRALSVSLHVVTACVAAYTLTVALDVVSVSFAFLRASLDSDGTQHSPARHYPTHPSQKTHWARHH